LHSAASPEALGLLRILVFGFWVWHFLTRPLGSLAQVPVAAFEPFGMLSLVPEAAWGTILSPGVLTGLQVLVVATCGAALLGLAVPLSPWVAVVAAILGQGVTRGFGYVPHATLPLLAAAVVLAASPCADALTLRRQRQARPVEAYQFPLTAIAGFLLFAYTAIGIHRLVFGGPQLFAGDALRGWIFWNNLIRDPVLPWLPGLLDRPGVEAVLRAGFAVVTLLEASALVALVWAPWRPFFLVGMTGAHLAIYGMMGINFVDMVLLYITLIDSRRWAPVHPALLQGATVFYDGWCSLCDGFVGFMLPRRHRAGLRFAPLQGQTAALTFGGRPPGADSIVLVDAEGTHFRSAAVLRAVSGAGGGWSFAALLGLVPRWFSDPVYDAIAANRYRWFPRLAECRLPGSEERAALLP
jgi:predicted DCC family thiol-disulfide oxidoreductase YuxK